MRALVILSAATGLSLVFSGCTSAAPRLAAGSRSPASYAIEPRLIALSLALAIGIAMIAFSVTGSLAVGAAAGAAAASAPISRARAARRRRCEALAEAWPDALSNIIAGIRAGMGLPECCCALSERGPEQLREGFSAFTATYRSCGSFSAALQRLADELQDPIGDRVGLVLALAHEVGGTDLVRVLRATCDFIRDDLRIRGEVRARWSWTLNAARVAAATPFAVLMVMSVRPEARLAYASSSGAVTIIVGTLVTFAGYRLMLRAGRLPEERRLG